MTYLSHIVGGTAAIRHSTLLPRGSRTRVPRSWIRASRRVACPPVVLVTDLVFPAANTQISRFSRPSVKTPRISVVRLSRMTRRLAHATTLSTSASSTTMLLIDAARRRRCPSLYRGGRRGGRTEGRGRERRFGGGITIEIFSPMSGAARGGGENRTLELRRAIVYMPRDYYARRISLRD